MTGHTARHAFLPSVVLLTAAAVSLSVITGVGLRAQATSQAGTVVFEGARIINGTGGPAIENGVLVVADGHITAVGRAGAVRPPAGATRVSLIGKTVMPAIVDTHTHLSSDRATLEGQLRAKAYYGVSAAMSMGQDAGTVPFEVRANPVPGAALFRTAGRGITMPEPGRTTVPYWITTEAEGRAAVQELAANKVDIVKIWVDDRNGTVKKMPPELYIPIIDEAHKQGLRVNAHLFNLVDAKGLLKAGLDAMAHGVATWTSTTSS
jgi:imidazolonepropionase-like amidohydrolase